MRPEQLNALAKQTLDAAFRVHTTFGPGLLESAYAACLVYELGRSGLEIRTEVPAAIVYDGVKMVDVGCRIDILVANELVIEVKIAGSNRAGSSVSADYLFEAIESVAWVAAQFQC